MNKRDAKLQSILTTTTVTANGVNYGGVIAKSDMTVGENKVKAWFRITTAFAAGAFTLEVYSDDTATPTTLVARSPEYADRTALAVGDEIDVPIPANVLGDNVRLAVNNGAVSATGAMEGELVPLHG